MNLQIDINLTGMALAMQYFRHQHFQPLLNLLKSPVQYLLDIAEINYMLGYMLFYGQGIAQNEPQAVDFFQAAAKEKHPNALFSLAICYWKGKGVRRNFAKAIHFLREAASEGKSEAWYYLKMLEQEGL